MTQNTDALAGAAIARVFAENGDATARGFPQTAQNAQQSCFAGAIASQQRETRAAIDVERDVTQCGIVAVILPHAFDGHGMGSHGVSRWHDSFLLYCFAGAAATRMPSSRNTRSETVDGASLIKSVARAVFGKGITSRMDDSPARIITRRSSPSAIPPCGGAPYSNASSRNPKRFLASSSENPSAEKTLACTSRRWIRMDPEPSSTPFSTMSYDFARQRAGSLVNLSRSSS